MSDETKSGRGQLRDTRGTQGVYDVDYTVRVNIRVLRNIGAPATERKTVNVNIKLVNGYILKNGTYFLEENGNTLYQLEKAGTDWQVLS